MKLAGVVSLALSFADATGWIVVELFGLRILGGSCHMGKCVTQYYMPQLSWPLRSFQGEHVRTVSVIKLCHYCRLHVCVHKFSVYWCSFLFHPHPHPPTLFFFSRFSLYLWLNLANIEGYRFIFPGIHVPLCAKIFCLLIICFQVFSQGSSFGGLVGWCHLETCYDQSCLPLRNWVTVI